ncbi:MULTISPECIES: hypothetical protein [unclassified Nocardioides]|uniref:hypothetical protein n=1 Tax=unclassified Nocardioides TaxID=2615069 RepID=UPI00070391D8|nr:MULTISPECIES: hypothetical protein [unclassified Nocardioides]KRC53936.1 hypothetical protein ASE19_07600 [Nocardioides sp. Root79]KRC71272.1 hypothetical protein ASE20_10015 [Nocardioides sp. Root240]
MTGSSGHLNPWDRQPGESNPAWEAFKAYRDIGLSRSTAKVQQSIGKSKRLIDGWSSQHAWVLRARAWDAEQDRLWQTELRDARRELAKRNVNVARALLTVGGKGLAEIAAAPGALRPNEVARLVEASARIQQLLPADEVGRSALDDDIDLDELTDEEIVHHLLALKRELEADLAEYVGLVDGDTGDDPMTTTPYEGDD